MSLSLCVTVSWSTRRLSRPFLNRVISLFFNPTIDFIAILVAHEGTLVKVKDEITMIGDRMKERSFEKLKAEALNMKLSNALSQMMIKYNNLHK